MKKYYIFIVLLILTLPVTGLCANHFIRPNGGNYGNEDGSDWNNAFDGFPGQFSAFVFKTLGNQGILKLMAGEKNRGAEFRTCAVFFDGVKLKTFIENCRGTIIEGSVGRGGGGIGYDPLFIPDGHNLTFAEDFAHKLKISHRTRAYEKLFNNLIRNNCE